MSLHFYKLNLVLNIDSQVKNDYLLLDVNGKTILSGSFEIGLNKIKINNIQSGLYFLNLKSNKGTMTKKIIIE